MRCLNAAKPKSGSIAVDDVDPNQLAVVFLPVWFLVCFGLMAPADVR